MSLKTRAILVLVIGIVMGSGLSIGGGFLSDSQPVSDAALAPDQVRLLAEVMERVKQEFVEPIDDSVLLESAIRGMVSNLDPHSEYLDADEYRDIRVSTTGSYTGVGIEVSQANGVITVITPIAGSPAARADIRSGDRIVGILHKRFPNDFTFVGSISDFHRDGRPHFVIARFHPHQSDPTTQ